MISRGLFQWKPPKVTLLSSSTRRLATFRAFSEAEKFSPKSLPERQDQT